MAPKTRPTTTRSQFVRLDFSFFLMSSLLIFVIFTFMVTLQQGQQHPPLAMHIRSTFIESFDAIDVTDWCSLHHLQEESQESCSNQKQRQYTRKFPELQLKRWSASMSQ
mmetsp:Transcript_1585/g.3401  ORF Transcript_1585/g.3401 Transcript_1585/m.3401 type:complete len:109 (+) Transcript_1585:236-562(+)